jgi:hypothetical protein
MPTRADPLPVEAQILYCSTVRMGRLRLRITDRDSSLSLAAILLALILTLALAASAQAEDQVSGVAAIPTDAQESPGSQNPAGEPPGGEQLQTVEGAPEGQGPTPGGASEEPAATAPEEPAASSAPGEQPGSPAPEEPTVPATPGETVVTGTTEGTTPVEVQSGPPVEETPVAVVPDETIVTAEVTKETPQSGPTEGLEEATSKTLTSEHAESTGEASSSTPLRSSSLLDTPVAQLAVTRPDPAESSVASGPGALPVIATIASTEVEGPPPGSGPPSAHSGMTSAQRAGSFSCELSQLGGSLTDNCTVGWLGAPRFLPSSSTGLVTVASSLVAATIAGSPSDGGRGGSAISSPPVGPAPGPAPAGASGAATGATGVAPLSTFLTLAGLLLLGAPRVLRRLRLSCEPWLAGCFVLVPERPD